MRHRTSDSSRAFRKSTVSFTLSKSMLSNIIFSREDAKIPKRGDKDFEPHATALQSNALAASRQAMHAALSYERIQQPKGHTLATYHPETNMAYVYNPKGPHFTKMGQVLSAKDDAFGDDGRRGQRMWLLPEEVLYLLERGTVDLRWPAVEGQGDGLPMSLQGAYAMFLGDEESHGGSLTFERYCVYSGLKRAGYTVLRAPSWASPGPPLGKNCFPDAPLQRTWNLGLGLLWSWWPWTRDPDEPDRAQKEGPLVQPGLYRSFPEIYRRLALINSYDPSKQYQSFEPHHPWTDESFRITYNVWKPGSVTFKKSAPGEPDFRISVVNARETTVPTLEQLTALMETVPYQPPEEKSQLYQKLRHGYKSVILAVVDQGVVSYLRMADAGFGREKLYERKGKGPGGKRGGRGGRGGRGRGG